MSRGMNRPTRLSRRIRVAYAALLAREDARRYGVTIPSGLWICARCGGCFWNEGDLAAHLRLHASGCARGLGT